MERVAVELGVHGDGGDAELAAGPDDADGDLAAVGDQDLCEHGHMVTGDVGVTVPDRALAGTRFADVRWVAETGSTNPTCSIWRRPTARPTASVARGRPPDRRPGPARPHVEAPPGASLLVSVLLRPGTAPSADAHLADDGRRASAAVEACRQVAGVPPRLKWPNDLVWSVDGDGSDRKLGGILAESMVAGRRARRRGRRARPQRELAATDLPDRAGRHRRRAQPPRRRTRRPRGAARRSAASGSTTGPSARDADARSLPAL